MVSISTLILSVIIGFFCGIAVGIVATWWLDYWRHEKSFHRKPNNQSEGRDK